MLVLVKVSVESKSTQSQTLTVQLAKPPMPSSRPEVNKGVQEVNCRTAVSCKESCSIIRSCAALLLLLLLLFDC
jgi:hypothetical protein